MSWTEKKPLQIKHSIRKKMTILFSVVLLAALTACWLANNFFLEQYYVGNKEEILKEAYGKLDEASGTETLEEAGFIEELGVICETNDISLLVMGYNGQVKIYTMKNYDLIRNRYI